MYSSTSRFEKKFFSPLFFLLALPATAFANGLSLDDQSASASGVSNAGAVADPQDASIIFFNPAGMSRLSGTNVSFGHILFEIDAEGRDSKTRATRANGDPVEGDGGGDHVDISVVPNGYLSHEVNEWLDVGIGVFVPYGLGFDYGDDFAGRFIADEVELVSFGLSPSFAMSAGDDFSVGASMRLLYAQVEQQSAVDFSGVEAQFRLPRGTLKDGELFLDGNDFSIEFTFGMLWQATPETSIGLAGRTGTKLNLEGTGKITNFPGLTGAGLSQSTVSEKVKVPVRIPESITVGIANQYSETVKLLAGATWTNWSRVSPVTVVSREEDPAVFPSGEAPTARVKNWEDTWQVSLGTVWQASPAWAFKAGYGYSESPVTLDNRSPATPFDDNHQISLGAQVKDVAGSWTVDLFITRVFYEGDITIDYEATDPAQGQTSFKSEYDVKPWLAGIQTSRTF